MKKVIEYKSYDEDVVTSSNQDYKLKSNYKWIHKNIIWNILSYIVYWIILLVALIYKLVRRISYKNKRVLKGTYFLYGNHTSQFGDILNPFLICFPRRPYLICSPANLGIPVIGKILPLAGALPIPDDLHGLVKFKKAVEYRSKKGNPIIIYPEAHLWPWYTGIRDYTNVSFHYPVDLDTKVYSMTTTYIKSNIFNKPNINIYIDGPFIKNNDISKKENAEKFRLEVLNKMKSRSKSSNCKFITYKKKD